MTTRAIERVDEWDTRPYGGGYRGLHDLAERDFSGVVRSPAGTLCMLNGAVVGIVDGRIEEFEGADGTAYEAPCPALPLLVVMQDRAEDVRAKYYTEDTPLSKVDSTLSDGGFTGYVELSENVLSGDYYVVYQGGHSMSVAFVGNSGQLLSSDEAFERADDEVGIYQVRDVDIEPIDIPEPAEPAPSSGTTAAETTQSDEEPPADKETSSDATGTEETDTATTASAETSAEGHTTGTASGGSAAEQSTVARDPSERTEAAGSDSPSSGSAESGASAESEANAAQSGSPTDSGGGQSSATASTEQDERMTEPASTRSGETSEPTEPAAQPPRESTAEAQPTRRQTDEPTDSSQSGGQVQPSAGAGEQTARSRSGDERPSPPSGEAARSGGSGSAADLETRTIPSLDPDRSRSASGGARSGGVSASQPGGTSSGPGGGQSTTGQPGATGETGTQSTTSQPSTTANQQSPAGSTQGGGQSTTGPSNERVEQLEETIAEREQRIDDLESKLATVREERDDLQQERDEIKSERDGLERERDELEETLDRVRGELKRLREERDALEAQLESAEGVDPEAGERRLSPGEAMDGTDLFVRYDSKGEPTLKTAHDSGASRSDVNANLNVEWHTQFETDGAVVGGHPFETYLQNTIEYRFVSWAVRELLFEIRETGHHNALSDLYDALPLIDRAELNGEAAVKYTEDGQTKQSREAFDVVLRDRMGDPLIVANFNDTRQAATEDDMRSLVTAATRVGETAESLAGAIFVTASFFEPEALEMASDATGGGLLSRDKRESFVKVSRKQGYHLCLVEARDQQFHMAVPEL